MIAFSNGSKYEGEWVQDKREGKGKFTWNNGDTYEGDFKDDRRTGTGILILKSNCSLYLNMNCFVWSWLFECSSEFC